MRQEHLCGRMGGVEEGGGEVNDDAERRAHWLAAQAQAPPTYKRTCIYVLRNLAFPLGQGIVAFQRPTNALVLMM